MPNSKISSDQMTQSYLFSSFACLYNPDSKRNDTHIQNPEVVTSKLISGQSTPHDMFLPQRGAINGWPRRTECTK